jgi:uncharacterized protein (DUF433 family)
MRCGGGGRFAPRKPLLCPHRFASLTSLRAWEKRKLPPRPRRAAFQQLPRHHVPHTVLTMVEPIISRDPEVMGGTPVFAGTRVPVQTLLDYLEAGESIDDFLEGFPSVSRERVIAFLEQAKDRLVESVS